MGLSIAGDRYAGMLNNTLKFIDPSGNKACFDFDINGQCIPDIDWFLKGRIPLTMPDGVQDDGLIAWQSMTQLNVEALSNGINMTSSDWLTFVISTEYYGTFGPDAKWNQAMARRYRTHCSNGPYTNSCMNGFWGYMQATRNGNIDTFNEWIIFPDKATTQTWEQSELISTAIRNPSQPNSFGITSSMNNCNGYRCEWATITQNQGAIYNQILELYQNNDPSWLIFSSGKNLTPLLTVDQLIQLCGNGKRCNLTTKKDNP